MMSLIDMPNAILAYVSNVSRLLAVCVVAGGSTVHAVAASVQHLTDLLAHVPHRDASARQGKAIFSYRLSNLTKQGYF